MPLSLTIVTPEENVVKDLQVENVVMPAADGEVMILPGHTPLLTALGVGQILTHSKTEDIHFLVTYGFAQVRNDKVSIFAEALEPATEFDLEKAEKARAETVETVMNTVLGELEYAKYIRELEIAHKRVELAKLVKELSATPHVGAKKKKG